jgi:hypothetical protein
MRHYISYDYREKQEEAKTMSPGIGHEQPCAEQPLLLSARGFEFWRRFFPRNVREVFEKAFQPEQMGQFSKLLARLLRSLEPQAKSTAFARPEIVG